MAYFFVDDCYHCILLAICPKLFLFSFQINLRVEINHNLFSGGVYTVGDTPQELESLYLRSGTYFTLKEDWLQFNFDHIDSSVQRVTIGNDL